MEKDFIRAAKEGDLAKITEFLNVNPGLISVTDSDGSTALHCASWKGHVLVVRLLLGLGADVNAKNENSHWGTSPLHAAAHANHAEIAQVLIDGGANVNALDPSGNTPLHHTTIHKAARTAKVLRNHGAF